MRSLLIFILSILLIVDSNGQIIDIPDPNFRERLIASGVDINNDGNITIEEANEIEGFLSLADANIVSLTGINYFINLKTLDCRYNKIKTIDFANLSKLTEIRCELNEIEYFANLDQLINFKTFSCYANKFSEIDFTGLISLESIT